MLDLNSIDLSKATLLEANAGCGKTYALKELYRRLVVETGLSVEEIVVVTYTRAATAELRERIREDLQNSLLHEPTGTQTRRRLEKAVQEFDLAQICTMHGFCQRVLSEHAFESGTALDAELRGDIGRVVADEATDLWHTRLQSIPQALLSFLHQAPGYDLASLINVGKAVVEDPALPWLPQLDDAAPPSVGYLDDLEADWQQALHTAAELWTRNRTEVLTCLASSSSLHRGRYRPDTVVRRWAPALDSRFASRQLPSTSEPLPLLAQSRMVTRKDQTPPSHPFFVACEALLEREQALRQALERLAVCFRDTFLSDLRSRFRRRRREQGDLFFSDLIHILDATLQEDAGRPLQQKLRAKYRAALVDEFQDTDPAQYRILSAIFGRPETPLVLIGDPKQAIYAFRGADMFAYLGAVAPLREHQHQLTTNWRSDPLLVDAINLLLAWQPAPFLLPELGYRPISARPGASNHTQRPPFRFLFASRQPPAAEDGKEEPLPRTWNALPRLVAQDLAQRLSTGETFADGTTLTAGDFAVLCRTNSQTVAIQNALEEEGVATRLLGQSSVLDGDTAADFEVILRSALEPRDQLLFRNAAATRLVGFRASHLAEESAGSAEVFESRGALENLGNVLRERGFLAFALALREFLVVHRGVLTRPTGTRAVTDILHLGELLQSVSRREGLGPDHTCAWLADARRDPALRSGVTEEELGHRSDSDVEAVTITTIHKSKGLEFPCVYCPFLWDGMPSGQSQRRVARFHDATNELRLTLDLGSTHHARHLAQADAEGFAESLRLAYVAITRAKHHCTVVVGGFRGFAGSALGRWLLESPARSSRESVSAIDALQQHTATTRAASDPSDAELLAALSLLARQNPAAFAVDVVEDVGASRQPSLPTEGVLRPRRKLRHSIDRGKIVTSFSALVRQESDGSSVEPTSAEQEYGSPWASVPRGPSAGSAVHSVLECAPVFQEDNAPIIDADGAAPLAARLKPFCEIALRVAGLLERTEAAVDASTDLPDQLAAGLELALLTQLPSGHTLADLRPSQLCRELEFTVPLSPTRPTSARTLAHILSKHDYPAPDYAQHVAELGFEKVSGFLRGYIDLVFEWDGRFWIADYKTNDLGNPDSSYGDAALQEVMNHHHYHLQALFYVLAVDRHLQSRHPHWCYEQHFGGAMHLFLRAMTPETAARGVCLVRPTPALLHDLQQWLDTGEAA